MFPEIDWTRPWYDTVRPAFESLQPGPFVPAFNANAARLELVNHAGQAIRFVPQADLPEGVAYEAFIGATGCVPTRANLHDFFNGLVWQTFPRIKRELNALQAAQIAQAGVGKSRGPARDAATIFDENAALLVVRDGDAGRALDTLKQDHRRLRVVELGEVVRDVHHEALHVVAPLPQTQLEQGLRTGRHPEFADEGTAFGDEVLVVGVVRHIQRSTVRDSHRDRPHRHQLRHTQSLDDLTNGLGKGLPTVVGFR